MTLEEIERLLATDYGIQALNTHHVRWLVAEVKRLRFDQKMLHEKCDTLAEIAERNKAKFEAAEQERDELRERIEDAAAERKFYG